MRIYFDACCLSRPTDDQAQDRIRREAEAVERLLGFVTNGSNVWVSSVVLEAEIARNPETERRQDATELLWFAHEVIDLDADVVRRARELERVGFSAFDALHLACAEAGKVDVFLTTDDRLSRRAQRGLGKLTIRVLNPVSLIEEVFRDAHPRND